MNRTELYMARLAFKLKIHESDGQRFEDLFIKVMGKANRNFQPVKAWGRIGDMKNDGFDRTSGTYYQVYAPETTDKLTTIKSAVKKVRDDFNGLKKHWHSICPMKQFYYVVNDKYKGLAAPIHQELMKLENENNETKCNPFTSKNLEDAFISLNIDDIIDVISFIPDDTIGLLDYSVLNEAVAHIKGCSGFSSVDDNFNVPDFGEKLIFNKLSNKIEHYLTFASYQLGDLDEYFKVNSEYVKTDLQKCFKEMYEESKREILADEDLFADKRFMYILKKASAKEDKAHRDAVLVLMAYYFEACDIFEEPVKEVVM